MKTIKFVVKVNRGGTRAPEYVQRIDPTPIQMTTNRKLALIMGKFTAEDAVKSLQNSRCIPELEPVHVNSLSVEGLGLHRSSSERYCQELTASLFCRSAVIEAQCDQFRDVRFPHAHDCVCAPPVEFYGSIGLRNGAACEDHVVDISSYFPRILWL